MQVSQLVELDTHVVIGGGKARSFSMSDSAEFFTVLSDTLYRDKKRAVVREVICNGWDAHVMNDCTDRALEVTLTDDELIIKDFGPGISDDRIVPIYCVYGASTKVKDESQTGGFGLGSKAPFAYTDHFTVTSCFEGQKIVYAISRGGSATDGKPEIRQMVAIPTQETGITVTIPLRNKDDKLSFARIIRSVAYQGGMKVKLNGSELETLDYAPARANGFCAVASAGDLSESKAYLLYGTVLYPISTTDQAITGAVASASAYIPGGYRLVLIAPPNSVGVTPSRESLSYSELTTNTILRLLKRADGLIRSELPSVGRKIITGIGATVPPSSLAENNLWKHLPTKLMGRVLATARQICEQYVTIEINGVMAGSRRRWLYDGMIKAHPDMRAHLRSSRARNELISYSLRRYKFGRFVKMAKKLGLLDGMIAYNDHYSYSGPARMTHAKLVETWDTEFHPSIFVGPNKRDITSMVIGSKSDPTSRSRKHFLGLAVGNKPSTALLERVRAAAKEFGFTIVEYDFQKEKPKIVRVKRPTELYHRLSDYMEDKKLVEATLEKPKFFMRSTIHNEIMRVGIDNSGVRFMLNNMFADIALVTTKPHEEKLRKSGVRNVIEVVAERLVKLIKVREVQYGVMIDDKLFVEGNGSRHSNYLGNTAVSLAKKHGDIARIIFPDRAKLGSVWKEAKQLIAIMRSVSADRQGLPLEAGSALHIATYGLQDAAKMAFADMIVPQARCEKHFGYLSMLVGSDWLGYGPMSERQRAELIAVLRYLQRINDKSKFTPKTKTIAQKEAA